MYCVTRQLQWPDGTKMVEVSQGDFNFTNPGQLTAKWEALGEGKEFTDPREAVEAAVQIAEVWSRLESSSADPDEIFVGHGATGGMTMPFSSSTTEEMRAWAEKVYDALPKCEQCGCVLGKETYHHEFCHNKEEFCSTYCCEKHYTNYNLHGDEEECEDESTQRVVR